ncbi:hypothetical protein GGTG_07641 [Gaeumannomyces tritici R3-111a-1]|uniref:Uncharacterized protein n=1 Tax=Gaeumannomyces tritici (strain R3-111a-1) TaxID=644352 RepID=J3P293_GAET3|nr:hypothetical protein GGTG_07641 [Gaeumannomyces tritici R3-111a-1]EJT73785.1 hypothetical protein GGTG_07641 [Gaeumannomyces tritici R3-111a-1]
MGPPMVHAVETKDGAIVPHGETAEGSGLISIMVRQMDGSSGPRHWKSKVKAAQTLEVLKVGSSYFPASAESGLVNI